MTEAEERQLRLRFIGAKEKLQEAVEWKARAEARLKEAEAVLYQVMEDMLERVPRIASEPSGEGAKP